MAWKIRAVWCAAIMSTPDVSIANSVAQGHSIQFNGNATIGHYHTHHHSAHLQADTSQVKVSSHGRSSPAPALLMSQTGRRASSYRLSPKAHCTGSLQVCNCYRPHREQKRSHLQFVILWFPDLQFSNAQLTVISTRGTGQGISQGA